MTKLKEQLRSGGVAIAVTVNFPHPALMEFLCWCGFDALVLDGEHGVASEQKVEDLARVCEAAGAASVVRLPFDRAAFERFAAFGVSAFHLPQVKSAETVSSAAAALFFAPEGSRGLGNFRAGRYGFATGDMRAFMAKENSNKTLIVAIEDREGIGELDAVVANEAVDVVLIGTSDLANDLGHPGETRHAEVLEAVDHIAAVVSKSGKALGLPAKTPRDVAQVIDRGARYILTSVTGTVTPHLLDVVSEAHD